MECPFYIRATQGSRNTGPIQITTRMKEHCDYDEATLNHEPHLDLNEIQGLAVEQDLAVERALPRNVKRFLKNGDKTQVRGSKRVK